MIGGRIEASLSFGDAGSSFGKRHDAGPDSLAAAALVVENLALSALYAWSGPS